MKNKKILIVIILLCILVGIIVCFRMKRDQNSTEETDNQSVETEENQNNSYVEEIEDGIKINKSNKLNEAKEVENYRITNIQLSTRSGMTMLLADIENISDSKTTDKTAQIVLVDKDGNELVTVTGIIKSLEPGATTQLNIGMTSNFIDAYDFKVSIK